MSSKRLSKDWYTSIAWSDCTGCQRSSNSHSVTWVLDSRTSQRTLCKRSLLSSAAFLCLIVTASSSWEAGKESRMMVSKKRPHHSSSWRAKKMYRPWPWQLSLWQCTYPLRTAQRATFWSAFSRKALVISAVVSRRLACLRKRQRGEIEKAANKSMMCSYTSLVAKPQLSRLKRLRMHKLRKVKRLNSEWSLQSWRQSCYRCKNKLRESYTSHMKLYWRSYPSL